MPSSNLSWLLSASLDNLSKTCYWKNIRANLNEDPIEEIDAESTKATGLVEGRAGEGRGFKNKNNTRVNSFRVKGRCYSRTAKILFFDDTIHRFNSLFFVLRDYLILKGFKYNRIPKCNKLTNGIEKCLFLMGMKNILPVKRLGNIRSAENKSLPNKLGKQLLFLLMQSTKLEGEPDEERQKAHNMSQRLMTNESDTVTLCLPVSFHRRRHL